MAGTSRTATGDHAIGIDLGTTYCCVGYWRDNRVEIIPNDQGKRTTRSYVAFEDEGHLIGEAAYNGAARDPANTVFDAKRLIGKRFSDESVKSNMKLWPFKVISDKDDKPMISVTYQGKQQQFAAEDISRIILMWLKQTAEDFIGSEVNDAVITVPAYFDHWQRQATIDAGVRAGINVLHIIDEPVAAAIAYSFLDSGFNVRGKRRNVLIFDLGGGTFDVAVLSVEDDSITVKAKWGDTHLGGEDFDNRLVNHFISEFKKKHKRDISGNPRAIRRLKSCCQMAKESLNSTTEARIYIDSLFEGIDYNARLARSKFEELNMDLFKKCIEGVEKCLDKAEMDKKHIDDVVLVGGSSRILKVQEMLGDLFEGKRLYKSINADEAVAYGAAIKAAKLAGQGSLKIENLVLVDVVPLSIGVGVVGNVMDVLIPKNTTIPARVMKSFTTVYDYQTRIVFPVFEGERAKSTENKQIGEVELHGIEYARMGEPWIDVCFDLQADGILSVFVRDRKTGGESRAAIQRAKLSVNEVERVMGDANQHMAEDEMHRKKSEARTRFVSYVNGMRSMGRAATQMDKKALLWLNTKTELAEVSEYEEKMQELKRSSFYWN